MNSVYRLYIIIKHNVVRQMRSYPFFIVIGLTIFLSYACVPAASAGYEVFYIGGVRGEYNSNWLGGMGAVLSSMLIWLFGFYMLRSGVSEDERLRTEQLIASSPVSNFQYIFMKTFSHFVVFVMIEAIFITAFIVMQFVRGEDISLQIGGYLYPFFYIVLPSFTMLAALTVFFDVCPGLKGVIGNVIFFFLWVFLGVIALENPNYYSDVFGLHVIITDMFHDAMVTYEFLRGSEEGGSFGYYVVDGAVQTFQWDGVTWSYDILLTRALWLFAAMVCVSITSLLFTRFRNTQSKNNPFIKKTKVKEIHKNTPFILTTIKKRKKVNMLSLIKAEILLMLKGFTVWWYMISIGIIIFGMFCPLSVSKSWLPVTMIWPIAVWSQMITKAKFYRTDQMILSSCSPFYQFFAAWIVGMIVSLIISSGVIVQFLLLGETVLLMSWLSSIVFIPTLSLALGVWSGSRKLFEVVFILWWYLGPVNGIPYLDFLGIKSTQPILYVSLSFILLCIAIVGRQRMVRS
ncbi:hypothetical protein, partial [Bacillus manliponensis]|uniref:hypothetical protein n=1 Tax=Bacillus manliponensis TaxID=574376 RepID=UPI0005514972